MEYLYNSVSRPLQTACDDADWQSEHRLAPFKQAVAAE